MLKKILLALLMLLIAGFGYLQLILVSGIDADMNGHVNLGPYEISDRAQSLHDTLYIADLHADSLMWQRNTIKQTTRLSDCF